MPRGNTWLAWYWLIFCPMRTCVLFTQLAAAYLLAASRADIVPFVLPWNDASPGATDFSGMNRPIGPEDRVGVNAAGHFVVRGERIRFLGMNFASDSPFMPTNKAEAVAARLARFGINNVRFHHIDAPWAIGGGLLNYTATSSRNINPNQLERMHFLVARLKAHGIYANINLLTGREYRSGDGLGSEVTTMDWKDQHILGFFNDAALNLHKEYATRLLTPTNRFTGLPLALDPAVAFVEIINENGLLQKWYEGSLDRLPARYAAALQAHWNFWLANRYADEAALLAAWQPIVEPLGRNLLRNGDFSAGHTAWVLEQHAGAAATFTPTPDFNGAPAAKITTTRAGSAGWHVQFNQPGLTVSNAQVYTLIFSAKADVPADLDVSVMQAHDPWRTIGLARTVRLSAQWQTFTNTFVAVLPSGTVNRNSRVNFGGLGTRLGSVWLADVRFHQGGSVGALPEGTSLAGRNLPNVRFAGEGYTGTEAARRDWLAFLRDREVAYYDAMVAHLRHQCGYPGLIIGTIMANSPATVQSRLDVVDAHAYWQHPQFPGQPWDPVNWIVPNVSMVTTTNTDNTLPGLSRQRIHGKPFTVTEYQHPSPNYYGAEGPLLLAAQAALQDWDGIWLFDYGPGHDGVTMGRIRGFFDTAQHPTKMANLLLAANLFRRGDLQPLTNEVLLALTPNRELDLLLRRAHAWSVFSSEQLGVPAAWAFTTRLSVAVGDNPPGLAQPPTSPPPPGQSLAVRWLNNGPGRGYVLVDTPRTRAAVGYIANHALSLGELELTAAPTELPWASVGLTVVRGESFTNGTFLVIASGWIENTGMRWKNANKDSVGDQWGTAPTRVEVVPWTLRLPVPAERVRAWILNERGQRQQALSPLAAGANVTRLSASADAATLWYEVEVAPPVTTGFERWRQEHFSPDELANPALSGPDATPAGDGVPNFVKYALAVPPKTSVRRRDLLDWVVDFSESGSPCLHLRFTRPKVSTDARVRVLASPNLSEWLPVADATTSGVVEDLGEIERVAVKVCPPGHPGAWFTQLVVEPSRR